MPTALKRAVPVWAGYLPPAATLVLFIAMALLWTGDHKDAYQAILGAFGLNIYDRAPPFLDTHAVLAAIECHAAGVDVFQPNPCDTGRRPHVYGSAWLLLAPLGLATSMTPAIGAALGLGFIAALFLLPRGQSWREILLVLAATISPATVFALERGNNDLVVWLLTLAGAYFAIRGPAARVAAYALASLGALLKFYPAALLVLLLRERPRRALLIGLPLGTALAWLLIREIAIPLSIFTPGGYDIDMFGAAKLASALLPGAGERPILRHAITLALAAYLGSISVRMAQRYHLSAHAAALPAFTATLALAGSSLLIACFFAGLSMSYRAILLLLVLPAILALWRDAADKAERRFFATIGAVLAWCLWSQTIWSHLDLFGLDLQAPTAWDRIVLRLLMSASELSWWWLIGVLIALAGAIARISPFVSSLLTPPAARPR